MADKFAITRALISVSDKTGIEELARNLHQRDIEIISTGGTMQKIKDAGIPVVSISTFSGSPEILGGRVKTLHPAVYAGILFRRDVAEDVSQMRESDFRPIDLVIANLYPFTQTLARVEADDAEIVENIDVGGPTMIRAAAKNSDHVTVVVDPADYDLLLANINANEGVTSWDFRRDCAAKAFALTSAYDTAIANYYACGKEEQSEKFPQRQTWNLSRKFSLRYGENPHQQASLYALDNFKAATLIDAELLSGKELSFNNYADLDACLDMLLDFDMPFACLLKHANPCGAAMGGKLSEAYSKAYQSDPMSAFGCIIGVNKVVDIEAASVIHETPFVECLLAPGFDDEALKLLKTKKNRRLLALPAIEKGRLKNQIVYRYIRGGLLVQTADDLQTVESSLKVVTRRKPTDEEIKQMLFAWKVVKHTKSNAIVLARDNATVGIGMGQTSRVDSSFMAVKRAGERAKGAVMASDAFFPMPDGLEVATEAGVTAVIQPGGSKGDEKVIEAADKAGVAMVFTSNRHFKH